MCDRYSCIVRVDGEIRHLPTNSHSEMVETAGWKENTDLHTRFVEAEWDGQGEYPGAEKICRDELNDKQRKAVDRVYRALALVIDDPAKHAAKLCLNGGIFEAEEWADLRFDIACDPRTPAAVTKNLCKTVLHCVSMPSGPLPAALAHVGGNLYLNDYAHPLPAALQKKLARK